MEAEDILKNAGEIMELYTKYGGNDYIGEPVSQVEHMCQCARLAEEASYGNEVILAAFFHDIGHLCEHILPVGNMDGFGTVDHEKIGAAYLSSKGFSEKITRLVASHVQAKRYLTYRYPEYYERLSPASKITLEYQGGIMTAVEAESFENDEYFDLYILLRGWDEQAKEQNIPLPDLNLYREMMIQHLMEHNP